MARGYFVTGTDTGVGKTTVTLALVAAMRNRGLKVAAMKPVAAGMDWKQGRWANDDVSRLFDAANTRSAWEVVNPYAFQPPIAPHIAAAQAGVTIELDHIASCYAALEKQADVVVVEGAGGFLVPLTEKTDMADLAQMLDASVILVVGMRLGCLNHALLTAEAIFRRKLRWGGWVANVLDPTMQALEENIVALEARLPKPYLGRLTLAPTPSSLHEPDYVMSEAEALDDLINRIASVRPSSISTLE